LTDPDAATSTVSLVGVSVTSSATSAPLPSNMPARIYPADGGVTSGDDLTGYTAISIMFKPQLGWAFVATNTISAGQILAYMPTVLMTALDITADQVKTFALQVWETEAYIESQDPADLLTLYVAFIPSSQVINLAQQIKAEQSPFYTGCTGIPLQLAQEVDPSFDVTSVADPISQPGTSGASNSDTVSSSTSTSDVRLDAIIGVCSALGGIALCILGWLVFRNISRRREMQHRRLSDPIIADATPTPGQEFDRDSVGGQRRRSFYYAEDSLRGFAQTTADETYDHRTGSAPGMRERRAIAPGTISAPILRDNTLNW